MLNQNLDENRNSDETANVKTLPEKPDSEGTTTIWAETIPDPMSNAPTSVSKGNKDDFNSKGSRRSCPEFLIKLVTMLRVENPEIMSWEAGRIYFRNPHRLITEVLKRYFRHANYNSFKRQLNYFGFRKVEGKGKMEPCVYSNEELDGLSLEEILHVKRKTNVGQELMVMPPLPKTEGMSSDDIFHQKKRPKLENVETNALVSNAMPLSTHQWNGNPGFHHGNDLIHRNFAPPVHTRPCCPPPYIPPPPSGMIRPRACHNCFECGAASRSYHDAYYPHHYPKFHGHSHGMHYPMHMPDYCSDSFRHYPPIEPHTVPLPPYSGGTLPPPVPPSFSSFPRNNSCSFPVKPEQSNSDPDFQNSLSTLSQSSLSCPVKLDPANSEYFQNSSTSPTLHQTTTGPSSPSMPVSVTENFERLINTAEMMRDTPLPKPPLQDETSESMTSSPTSSTEK